MIDNFFNLSPAQKSQITCVWLKNSMNRAFGRIVARTINVRIANIALQAGTTEEKANEFTAFAEQLVKKINEENINIQMVTQEIDTYVTSLLIVRGY